MKRLSGWGTMAATVVVAAMGWQLISAKRDNGVLRSAVRISLRDFVQGRSIPPMPVIGASAAGDLSAECEGRSGLLVYFVRSDCPYCQALMPLWRRSTVDNANALVAHVGDASASVRPLPHDLAVSGADMARHLQLRRVPAIVRADGECRIVAAGAGFAATNALLEELER